MHCFSSRVTSWLTWTLRVGGCVLRRRIGASVIRPSHLGWPTQQQRRSQEAVAVLWSQTIPWDRHRQIERKFCTIVGGVIAQELAIRNPERVARLVLFATFPGALFGFPAPWPVLRRLFGIEGLSPEEAARQVWPVTYSAAYLATQPDAVEAQMRREIAYPTPDHAARGQGAAIRAFSSALRLS